MYYTTAATICCNHSCGMGKICAVGRFSLRGTRVRRVCDATVLGPHYTPHLLASSPLTSPSRGFYFVRQLETLDLDHLAIWNSQHASHRIPGTHL
jgi:hypothetical protein